jgi:hypothetical protein
MSIRSELLNALRERFPERVFREGDTGTEIATFQAAHPGFGDLVIHDDGYEATIVFGTLMHTHVDAHYSRHAALGHERAVVEEVLDLLDDLFADRIVVWCVPEKSGGYYHAGGDSDHVPREAKVFVWSGPFRSERA